MNTTKRMKALFTVIATTSLLCGTPCPGEETAPAAGIDKSQLVGVWLAHKFESDASDTKPRVEFKKGGAFRMLSQFGDEKKGTWEWKSDAVVALTYPDVNKTIEITIMELSEEKMVSRVRRQTEYIRLQSWRAKAPQPRPNKSE